MEATVEEKHEENLKKSDTDAQELVEPVIKSTPPKPEIMVAYNGTTITTAATQGNLPVCVLLWGMASAKKQSLMIPDKHGNNPMHYACLAPTAEVMGFFLQQTRGMLTPEIKLIDSRNNNGETPLLRSVGAGHMIVIKTLLDEGSDVLATDNSGGTVLMNCAKNCQFWCLNFLYEHIKITKGVDAVDKLLTSRDTNDWTVLEWAIEAGDVNCVEFLIRKGLNPYKVSIHGQNALHIALSRHRIEVALFLLDVGCDAYAKDKDGIAPVDFHSLTQDNEMRRAIYKHPNVAKSLHYVLTCRKPLPPASAKTVENIEEGIEIPSMADKNNRSFAVRRISPTRLSMLLIYASVVFGFWLLAIVVPFYGWIPLVAAGAGGYSYISSKVSTLKHRAAHAQGRLLLDQWQQVICAPEKYVGFWTGNILAYIFYFLNVIVFTFKSEGNDDIDDHTAFLSEDRNPLGLSGLDCAKKDPALVGFTLLFVALTLVFWMKFMFFTTDPGIVDTRQSDFDKVMAESILAGGVAPDGTYYCRTTLVHKPIRSKYCTNSGFVVARMDHHCVWLNNAVGHGNHRTFMAFLYSHFICNICGLAIFIRILARETFGMTAWYVTGELISQRLLFVTGLTAFLLLISCFIGMLVVEQTHNIATNITTNEKVNRSRYWWLKAPDGRPLNRFDKGVFYNIMEFLGVPGFSIDYMSIFTLPEDVGRVQSSSGEATEMTTTSPMTNQHQHHAKNEHVHGPDCKHHH